MGLRDRRGGADATPAAPPAAAPAAAPAEDLGRRGQRQADRNEFGRRGSATTYKMREKLASFGDDFWIEDDGGQRKFKVNGKALRVRDTLIFEDLNGTELVHLQSKAIAIRDKMKIERVNGSSGVLTKDLVNVIRDEYTLTMDDGKVLRLKGNFLDHEYEFYEGDNKVGEVSKKWFRVRDTYGVQIEPGYDDILLLAATVAMDQGSHDVA
ncbi:MAG: LURP-one-related family protein [Actinomycetes bacterium]